MGAIMLLARCDSDFPPIPPPAIALWSMFRLPSTLA